MIYVAQRRPSCRGCRWWSAPTVAPESSCPALTAVASLDADLPLFQVQTMRERMQASLAVERLLAWLLAGFAGARSVPGRRGLYGVISYLTTIRTKEFGIRLALGATSSQVYGLVLRQSLMLVAAGLVLGLVMAGAASRLLTSLLFDVSPTDVMTYAYGGGAPVGGGSGRGDVARAPCRAHQRIYRAALRVGTRAGCCVLIAKCGA